jgi:hypothetical protein
VSSLRALPMMRSKTTDPADKEHGSDEPLGENNGRG